MSGRPPLFPHPEKAPQQTAQNARRLPDNDPHTTYLLFLRQTIPQAISRNATRNIKTPTGKTAAIRMPSPNASAQMPMIIPPQFHPLIAGPPLLQYMDAKKAECI